MLTLEELRPWLWTLLSWNKRLFACEVYCPCSLYRSVCLYRPVCLYQPVCLYRPAWLYRWGMVYCTFPLAYCSKIDKPDLFQFFSQFFANFYRFCFKNIHINLIAFSLKYHFDRISKNYNVQSQKCFSDAISVR